MPVIAARFWQGLCSPARCARERRRACFAPSAPLWPSRRTPPALHTSSGPPAGTPSLRVQASGAPSCLMLARQLVCGSGAAAMRLWLLCLYSASGGHISKAKCRPGCLLRRRNPIPPLIAPLAPAVSHASFRYVQDRSGVHDVSRTCSNSASVMRIPAAVFVHHGDHTCFRCCQARRRFCSQRCALIHLC